MMRAVICQIKYLYLTNPTLCSEDVNECATVAAEMCDPAYGDCVNTVLSKCVDAQRKTKFHANSSTLLDSSMTITWLP